MKKERKFIIMNLHWLKNLSLFNLLIRNNLENDDDLIEETMRNTLYNKYIGKLSHDNNENLEIEKDINENK